MDMTIRPDDAFIVVDLQYDFLPGGALAVPDGDAVIAPINALIKRFRRAGAHLLLTQDWHPQGHKSFASMHEGLEPFEQIDMPYGTQTLWPDHCVMGTRGAEIVRNIDAVQAELVIRKGYNREIDSYSAFRKADRKTPTGLGDTCANAVSSVSSVPDWHSISVSTGRRWTRSRRGSRRSW